MGTEARFTIYALVQAVRKVDDPIAGDQARWIITTAPGASSAATAAITSYHDLSSRAGAWREKCRIAI